MRYKQKDPRDRWLRCYFWPMDLADSKRNKKRRDGYGKAKRVRFLRRHWRHHPPEHLKHPSLRLPF